MKVRLGKPQWRKGFAPPVDAEVAHAEFEAIRAESNADDVKPEAVVERAKDKANPLHGCFEWNNRKAGDSWRAHQARNLINKLEVVVVTADKKEQPVKAYEVVNESGTTKEDRCSYRSIESIMDDPDARLALISRLLNQLVAIRARHRTLQELSVVWNAIDEAVTQIQT